MAKQALSVTYPKTVFRPNLSFLSQKSPKLSYLSANSFISVKSPNPSRTSLSVRSTDEDNVHLLSKFPPSLWGDYFLNYISDESEIQKLEREIEMMKPKVKDMITFSMDRPIDKIILIDTVSRIGISYHFDDDITEQLNLAFDNLKDIFNDETDLYSVAVAFRVFRHYGFNVSCDVFDRFKGIDGKFKKNLSDDKRGLMSLYEASFLGMRGEDTMDDAHDFAKPLLESFSDQSTSHLSELIAHILLYPHQHCLKNIDTRRYISFYVREDNPNMTILELAKLEASLVQMQHRKELHILTRWWKNIEHKLSYTRNRIVEIFFWCIGLYPEPCDSQARIMATKFFVVTTFVDDVYEVYGTLQELESFTDATQRWDRNSVDQLPERMQFTYKTILDVLDELENELVQQGRSFSLYYLKEEYKMATRAYLAELKWSRGDELPTYEEYTEAAEVTILTYPSTMLTIMLMRDAAWYEAFAWLLTKPKILSSIKTFGRLIDDVAGYKEESARGVLNGFKCYMKQHNLTEQETLIHYQKQMKDVKKLLNEEFMKPVPVSRQVILKVLYTVQILDMIFSYGDSFTYPEKKGHCNDFIKTLFVDPIP